MVLQYLHYGMREVSTCIYSDGMEHDRCVEHTTMYIYANINVFSMIFEKIVLLYMSQYSWRSYYMAEHNVAIHEW